MRDLEKIEQERRRVLELLGKGAVLLPLAGLAACSGEKSPPTAAEPPPAPAPEPAPASAPQAAAEPTAAEAPAEQGELPPLTEDDQQAVALGYVEDATTVDGGKYAQYQAGQACANCMLFQGGDAARGACSIFPGKSVKATGWCSVYAAKG